MSFRETDQTDYFLVWDPHRDGNDPKCREDEMPPCQVFLARAPTPNRDPLLALRIRGHIGGQVTQRQSSEDSRSEI